MWEAFNKLIQWVLVLAFIILFYGVVYYATKSAPLATSVGLLIAGVAYAIGSSWANARRMKTR